MWLLLSLLALAAHVAAILPRYPRWHSHGCNDTASQALPFCDTALPVSARVLPKGDGGEAVAIGVRHEAAP